MADSVSALPINAHPNTTPHLQNVILAAGGNPYLPDLDEVADFNTSDFNTSDFITPNCNNDLKATPEMQACMKYMSDPTQNLNNSYPARFEECIKKATLKQAEKIKEQVSKQECSDIEDIETVQQVMDNKKFRNDLVASKYIFANQRFLARHSYLSAAEATRIKNLAIQQWIEREWAKENRGLPPSDVISKQKGIIKNHPIIEQLALVEYYKEEEKRRDKAKQKDGRDLIGIKRGQ